MIDARLQSRFEPWRARAESWYTARSVREQRLLLAGLAVLALALLVVLIWRPLADLRAEARADIARYERLAAQIEAAGPLLGEAPRLAGVPVQTAITQSAAAVGLEIERLDPSANGAEVVIDQADFEQMVVWIDTLRRSYGIAAREVSAERLPEPGMVTARISFER